MKSAEYVVTPGVIIEDLGSESVVFVPGASEVLTLSGVAATVVRRIRNGESAGNGGAVVSDLVARGVIQPAGDISRRSVVRAGVIGAGAGIAALAMPSVAAASSTGDGGSSGGGATGVFYFIASHGSGAGGFYFEPQPNSALVEINDFRTTNGVAVTLTLDTGQTTSPFNGVEFILSPATSGDFGNSVVGTWELGPGETRTQTFLRQPDL